MTALEITIDDHRLEAELLANATAEAIHEALPLHGQVRRWGQELYFGIPVHLEASPEATTEVEVGDLAYWPAGRAFCLFFGPTPASKGQEPRAASPVNVFGRIDAGAELLDSVENGAVINVRPLE